MLVQVDLCAWRNALNRIAITVVQAVMLAAFLLPAAVRQLDLRSSRSGTQLLQLSRNGVRLEINSIAAPW